MQRLSTLLLLLLMCSCASIVSGSSYAVSINSAPSGAEVTVIDEDGRTIHKGVTPYLITLRAGSAFFNRATYTLKASHPDYLMTTQALNASIDGWYFGNILFGGLIGILIVDPLTGAMWRLPSSVQVSMTTPRAPDTGNEN